MGELPKGWTSAELENHVSIAGRIGWRGLKRAEYTRSGPLFLAVKNILENGEIDLMETEHISMERYKESPEIQLQSNDILLTKDGTIGKVGMIRHISRPTTVNSSILVVRPNNRLLNDRYLFHYLRGPQFQSIAAERITGSAVPHLFQKDIKKLKALIPPVNEQRRIVAKLEKLLHKVDACKDRLDKIPAILKRFRQSVLASACSGRLTADWRETTVLPFRDIAENGDYLPAGWRKQTFNEVASVVSGFAFSSKDFVRSGVPAIKIANVQYGIFENEKQEYLPKSFLGKYAAFAVQPQTLLLALTRPITNNLLKVCLYPEGAETGLLNQRVCKLEPMAGMSLKYLHLFMQTVVFKEQVKANLSETLQPNLSPKAVELFSIDVPPLPEQHEIVRRVEALFKKADEIEERYKKAKAFVDRLTQSILAKAFRGELVPQDPNDEPASVLLERIRKTKAKEETKGQRRRKKRAIFRS